MTGVTVSDVVGFAGIAIAGIGSIIRINQKQALLEQRLGQLEKSSETVAGELKDIHDALNRIELAVVGNQKEMAEQIKTLFERLSLKVTG